MSRPGRRLRRRGQDRRSPGRDAAPPEVGTGTRSAWHWTPLRLALLALVVMTLGLALASWRVSATDGPDQRVRFEGRSWDRGRQEALPPDAVRVGVAGNGDPVYETAADRCCTSVVVWLTEDDESWAYGLVGGP